MGKGRAAGKKLGEGSGASRNGVSRCCWMRSRKYMGKTLETPVQTRVPAACSPIIPNHHLNHEVNKMKPVVYVNKKAGDNGILSVIYSDRVETYHFIQSESKKRIEKSNGVDWSPEKEIEVLKANGFRQIR